MITNIAKAKVQAFIGYARCTWTQPQAQKIWDETMWKLSLKPGELSDLTEAWAQFVVKGNTENLDKAGQSILTRLGG